MAGKSTQSGDVLTRRGFRLLESYEMALCSAEQARPWKGDQDLLTIGSAREVDHWVLSQLSLFTDSG